jgi:hypothetical protein
MDRRGPGYARGLLVARFEALVRTVLLSRFIPFFHIAAILRWPYSGISDERIPANNTGVVFHP